MGVCVSNLSDICGLDSHILIKTGFGLVAYVKGSWVWCLTNSQIHTCITKYSACGLILIIFLAQCNCVFHQSVTCESTWQLKSDILARQFVQCTLPAGHKWICCCCFRLQYFARGVQVYIKQLRAALQGKTGDALKTEEVCAMNVTETSASVVSLGWIVDNTAHISHYMLQHCREKKQLQLQKISCKPLHIAQDPKTYGAKWYWKMFLLRPNE